MEGRPEAEPLLGLAERAENLGYDSVWIGDSLLARPRHEPITLLAGVAGRTKRVKLGTAVLLPALRNPVLLAHSVATLDQVSQGRVILGIGIATDVPNIRAEFRSRRRAVREARRHADGGHAALQGAVDAASRSTGTAAGTSSRA